MNFLDSDQVGGRMKDTDSSFAVTKSSFGITGGRYIHVSMNRAAVKAARQLFIKARKQNQKTAATSGNVVEFELTDITKGKGKNRSQPTSYRVTRTRKAKPATMEWKSGNKIVSTWSYKTERVD
jgi:hypothetical protein